MKLRTILAAALMLPTLAQAQIAETDTYATTNYTTVQQWPQTLQYRLDSLVRADMAGVLSTTQLGLCVYDITAETPLYSYQPRQLLRPASTEKLITAITALNYLGGAYTYQTRLCYTGSVKDGVLNGDVYAVGGFDPCFDSNDMDAFAQSLNDLGVSSISGRLYADVSMKDTLKWGSGWCWDDEMPILTPLLVNGEDEFMPELMAALSSHGITYTSMYSLGVCPSEAKLLCTRNHPLGQILTRMMKESDNLYAESMFYQLAARSGKRYAGATEAISYIQELIRTMGYNPDSYKFADGSGVSLYNYVTPELEVAFLRYAYANGNIYSYLLPTLPIAGEDGTLSRRMKNSHAYSNVCAKTGTVEGVSTLAGYATAPNGHLLVFSVMNQGILRAAVGRDFQGRVCHVLCMP